MSDATVQLRGMTWDHSRGYDPLVAAAAAWRQPYPRVEITWEKRSLAGFEQTPLDELARQYDLMVIDHPHVGEAAATGCLLDLRHAANDDALQNIAAGSLGGSYESYTWHDAQWALPIDAAAQVAAWRDGYREAAPATMEEVLDDAARSRMVWPLKPVHALMSFFSLAAGSGTPCAVEGPQLIEQAAGAAVLERMRQLAERVLPASFEMDPISASEAMVLGEADQCPMLYGYINYALAGYRPQRLCFGDLPRVGEHPRRSTLGGTGVCVSARCEHRREAVNFAVALASAQWQSGLIPDRGGQPAPHRGVGRPAAR